MSESRILDLLDDAIDTGRSPEEVCAACPELLPEVRRRLAESVASGRSSGGESAPSPSPTSRLASSSPRQANETLDRLREGDVVGRAVIKY